VDLSHDSANSRLEPPVKRDAYAEVIAKHEELIKRGEDPGSAHLRKRQSGDVQGNAPTITPAVAVDEDGQDISIPYLPNIANNQLISRVSNLEVTANSS
jgi:hypothetical protein